MRRSFGLAFVGVLALTGSAALASDVFGVGDLLLVHGWVNPCPERSRLLEVVRVERAAHALLGLGEFGVLGQQPGAIAAEIADRWAARTKRTAPQLAVERRAGTEPAASPEQEALLLFRALSDRECRGLRDLPKPDRGSLIATRALTLSRPCDSLQSCSTPPAR